MAIVTHTINGNQYDYEHKREGKKVRTIYIGRTDARVVSHIPAKGYPVDSECYKEGHKAGQEAEKKNFGDKKFKEFEKHIDKVVPEGELAGSHTEDGEILIHKNIDPKYHEQLVTHEIAEHEYMEAKACRARGAKPRTDNMSNRKVEAALRHPDKLGAGAKRRRELHLTDSEHVKAVMAEYNRGKLHTSSGKLVTSKDQALAIAYSEIRAKKG